MLKRQQRTSQPQQAVGIDWGNPISRGVRFACLPSVGLINLANGQTPISVASSLPTGEAGRPGRRWLAGGTTWAKFPANGLDTAGNRLTVLSIWLARDDQYLSGDLSRDMLSCRTAGNAGWSWGRFGAATSGSDGNVSRQQLTFQGVAQYVESSDHIESLRNRVVAARVSGTTISWFKDGVRSSVDATVGTASTGGDLVLMAQGPDGTNNKWLDRAYVTVAWSRALSDAEIASISANPWQLFAPVRRVIWSESAVGGGISLSIADCAHAHAADSFGLTLDTTLSIVEALHAHASDNLSLSTSIALLIADALHSHASDNLALSTQAALAIADALHAHASDNLDLSGVPSLAIQDALHAHTSASPTLTTAQWLTVADALHAHASDLLTLSVSGEAAVRAATTSRLALELSTAIRAAQTGRASRQPQRSSARRNQ